MGPVAASPKLKIFDNSTYNRIDVSNMEETLFNTNGQAVSYIAYDDEETIYMWGGKPVAYLDGEDIYGFNGKHLGWFQDGILRDHDGNIVGFNKNAANVSLAFEPFKAFKQFKPFRAFKEFAPFKPFYHSSYSQHSLEAFLMRGAK